MSSDAHLRRDHGTPTETSPYIDWGPDLPSRYEGGRARLLVANPTTLYVSWESDLAAPEKWTVETRIEGAPLGGAPLKTDLPGGLLDLWIKVPAGSRGEVHLTRDDATVAILPFRTPPDRPSANTSERWGRLGADGHVTEDVLPVIGRPLSSMEEADAAIAAARAELAPSSSSSSRATRP
jgi:hypothetical protein